jgi:aldehyde:ferredoxin oxidoreductase
MRILVIDLEKKEHSYFEDEGLRSRYIGGVGLNTALLYKNIDRTILPFDAKNSLFFTSGALVGTNIPTTSRCEATALSPTGYFGTANSGGKTGLAIKLCNIDSLWIKGKSENPVYALINEKGVVLKDASTLWGKDTFETVHILKEREGKDTEILSIGQAGEACVKFASIQGDYHHSFGRTGLGAIMGSKKLKAICFIGKGEIQIRDKKLLRAITKKFRERILSSDSFGYTRRYGSMVVSDVYNKLGILPGRNFRKGSFDNWETTRGRRFFEEKYKERTLACVSCPIGCLHWSRVKDGEYSGYETCGLEVTFTLEFGAKLDLENIPEIFQCVELCNRLGMDVISTSATIAYIIELFEKGFLKEADIGFRPAFGDFKSIYKLISMIGTKEGIGSLFSQGIKYAVEHFKGSESFACEIKGLEMPVRDPRGRFDTWMLGVLINTRGGDHLRIRTPVDDLKDFDRSYEYEPLALTPKELELVDMPQTLKNSILGTPPSKVAIPAMAKYSEEYITLLNSFGLCIRPPVLRTIGPSLMSEAFSAVYGYEMDENELLFAAERIVNMAHLFNLDRGLTFQEYRYPERFHKESEDYVKGERLPLDHTKIEEMLKAYFELRGWDETGHVKDETKNRLKIDSQGQIF